MNNEIQRLHFEVKRLNVQLEQVRARLHRLEAEKAPPKSVVETAKEVQASVEEAIK